MNEAIAALLLALLIQPAPATLQATWLRPGVARISWQQQERACLFKEPAIGSQMFIGCFEGAGSAMLELGNHGPLDAAYRPAAGDVYVLEQAGAVERTRLEAIIYLASFR